MFGFLFGVACCVGIYFVARGGPGHSWHGSDRWERRSWKQRVVRRFLFTRLDTTPGQERVITEAVDALEQRGQALRDDLRRSRLDIAQALRQAQLEQTSLDTLLSRQEAGIGALRRQLVEALGQVHAALDDRQRARLAEIVEEGPHCHRRARRWV